MSEENVFGKIEFVHSARAKYIGVKISAAGLKIILPPNATQNDAWRFINENKVKILAKQSKQKTVKKEFLTENSTLKTLTFNIVMQRAERENIFFSLKDDLLIIEFPVEIDCSTDDVQQQLWKGITYFLRKEAKRILPVQVRLLADRFGFYFSNVKIQQSKTRWGSCSSRKSINLSLYLLLLPQELIDYVILHELCHTKEMNHSPRFWQWMDKVTDNKSAALRRELKNFKTPKIY